MRCVGVCDSGVGGREALEILRNARPHTDFIYLADSAHAPYGTKSLSEVRRLVENDVSLLRSEGAEAVLIACVTASGAFLTLPHPSENVFNVLDATAEDAARTTANGNIAILATECSVRSGFLEAAVRNAAPGATVRVAPAQALVSLVETGNVDPDSPGVLDAVGKALSPFDGFDADTLVLGCTHFPRLSACFRKLRPNVHLISSGRSGALAMLGRLPPDENGSGAVRFLST